jgi:hypothetical protein
MLYTGDAMRYARVCLSPITICLIISSASIILWIIGARSHIAESSKHYDTASNVRDFVQYRHAEVFPVKATKKEIQLSDVGYYSACMKKCHNTYEAADIGGPDGTEIVVAVSGKVVGVQQKSMAQSKQSGASVRIQGSDGLWYYYTHMRADSARVHVGQTVRAGEVLGVMGTSRDAQGAAPHLHFDVSKVDNGFDRGVNMCSHACYQLTPPQPILRKAYQSLPEG